MNHALKWVDPAGEDEVRDAFEAALEAGRLDPLRGLIVGERWDELARRFAVVMARKDFDVDDLAAAREHVDAYVSFYKYAEGEDEPNITCTSSYRSTFHVPDGHYLLLGVANRREAVRLQV